VTLESLWRPPPFEFSDRDISAIDVALDRPIMDASVDIKIRQPAAALRAQWAMLTVMTPLLILASTPLLVLEHRLREDDFEADAPIMVAEAMRERIPPTRFWAAP